MRQIFIATFLFLSITSFGQKLQWIPFNWVGDSVSGKYFDKLAITIPVTLDNLPNKFRMQLDLGATVTVIYENSFKHYLDTYSELKNKIDTTLKFRMQSQTNYKFKNLGLKLGNVSFGNRNIGHFKNFGDSISIDSINTKSEKDIGTIAPDLFENKILIIDYPNKRICVTTELPEQFSKAQFRDYKIKGGRIKIPITINGKDEDVMFDTGSSLFALINPSCGLVQLGLERVCEDEKHEFEGKSLRGDGVYLFGKQGRDAADAGFDPLAEVLNQEGLRGVVGALAVAFSGGEQRLLARVGPHVLGQVVGVARVGVEDAALRQLRGQGPQASLVGFGPGVEVKVHRHARAGDDELDLEAVKIAPLAGRVAVVGLSFQQLAPPDAHVVANGDGERVDDVAGGGVQVLERFTQGVEHGPEHVGKLVQVAAEPALVQGLHAVVLAHIGGGRAPVAAEVAGGQQGRGQDFGVADLAALVGRSGAGDAQEIVQEAVHGNSLFGHGGGGMKGSNTSNLLKFCRTDFFRPITLRNLGYLLRPASPGRGRGQP